MVILVSSVAVTGTTLFYMGQTDQNVSEINSNYPSELKDYIWYITDDPYEPENLMFYLQLNLTEKPVTPYYVESNFTHYDVEANFTYGNRFQHLESRNDGLEIRRAFFSYSYPEKYGNDVKVALTFTYVGTDEYGDQKVERKAVDFKLDSGHFRIQPLFEIHDLKGILNRESGELDLTLTVEVVNYEDISSHIEFDAMVNFTLHKDGTDRTYQEGYVISNVIPNQQNSTLTWVYQVPTGWDFYNPSYKEFRAYVRYDGILRFERDFDTQDAITHLP